MRNTVVSLVCAMLMTGLAEVGFSHASDQHKDPKPENASTQAIPGLLLENLMHEKLEGVEKTEVIVSRVTIPPNTMLPKHWHPGEEFAYVLEGTVYLWQEGKEDLEGKPGDTLKIPLEQVHTAYTKDEASTVLVFRVHEQGKPERNLVK